MIYDLDTIDFCRHDKFRKTIYLTIYDTYMEDINPQEHKAFLDKKIELYVNYIISNGASNYFSISDLKGKKYKYIIQIILDFAPSQQYFDYIQNVDSQVSEYTNGRVHVVV